MDSLKSVVYTSLLLSIHTAYTVSTLLDRVQLHPGPSPYLSIGPNHESATDGEKEGVPEHVAMCIVLEEEHRSRLRARKTRSQSSSSSRSEGRTRKGKEKARKHGLDKRRRSWSADEADGMDHLEYAALACVMDAVRWAQERGIPELSVWQEDGLLRAILPHLIHSLTTRPPSPPTSAPLRSAPSSSTTSSTSISNVNPDSSHRTLMKTCDCRSMIFTGPGTGERSVASSLEEDEEDVDEESRGVGRSIFLAGGNSSGDRRRSGSGSIRGRRRGSDGDRSGLERGGGEDCKEEEEEVDGDGDADTYADEHVEEEEDGEEEVRPEKVQSMTIWPELAQVVYDRDDDEAGPAPLGRPLLLHILPHSPSSSALVSVTRKLASASDHTPTHLELTDRANRTRARGGKMLLHGASESAGISTGSMSTSILGVNDSDRWIDVGHRERDANAGEIERVRKIGQAELDGLIREEMHFDQDPALLIVHRLGTVAPRPRQACPRDLASTPSSISSSASTSATKSLQTCDRELAPATRSNVTSALLRAILPVPPPELHGYPAWPLRITEIYQPPAEPIYLSRIGLRVFDTIFRRSLTSALSGRPGRRQRNLQKKTVEHPENINSDEDTGLESGLVATLERREEWDRAVWRWTGVEQRLGR